MREMFLAVMGSEGAGALVQTMQEYPLGAVLLIALVRAISRAGGRFRAPEK